MWKPKAPAFLAIARKHFDYKGGDSVEDARKHLLSVNAQITDPDGNTVDLKTLEVEVVTVKALRLTAADLNDAAGTDSPATSSQTLGNGLPADLDIKIQAGVDAALKNLGVTKDAKGRPQFVNPTVIGTVKTMQERLYENQIRTKDARFDSYDRARGFQLWISEKVARCTHNPELAAKKRADLIEWHERNGLDTKAYATTSSTGGGALLPEAFQPDLIRNVLEMGAARKLSKVIQMPEQQVTLPRRTGGVSGSYPLENAAITASNATYDNVTLNAKTFAVLCQASRQILQDSGLPFADLVMEEIAYAVATQEDSILLIGDASATYAGITGFENKYGVTATDGGNVVVGGADSVSHTIADIANAIARVPQYARANMKITTTPTLSASIFNRLAVSTGIGGLTQKEITGMGIVNFWQNIPIIENNVMSSVAVASTTNRAGFTAGDQIDFLIGDFSRAALFGERLGLELEMSTERGFDAYSVYFRGVVRHDVNVHSIGSATAAGPVVSFWQT